MSYIIVGLGNPGGEYENSRHNAGRMAVQKLAADAGFPEFSLNKAKKALATKGVVGSEKVELVLPETFMNKSGAAVSGFVKSVKAAKQLVVVYDDLDLPLGKIRISFGRSSGGHRGVESISRALKTKDFIRVRIGVSKGTKKGAAKKVSMDETVDFILASFKKAEREILDDVLKRASAAIRVIVTDGIERAMNQYN
jgi:PTH1 family peptidyl-tRNA hydrolase